MTARLPRNPQPLVASLSKELKQTKQTLEHQSQELIKQRQLNHQLLRRIRELERELELGDQQLGSARLTQLLNASIT